MVVVGVVVDFVGVVVGVVVIVWVVVCKVAGDVIGKHLHSFRLENAPGEGICSPSMLDFNRHVNFLSGTEMFGCKLDT